MSPFWIDGMQIELTPEQIELFNPANPETSGVFETLRTYGGKIFKMDQHLARLQNSADMLGFALPIPLETIGTFLKQSEQGATGELRIKCVATAEHVFIQATPLTIDPQIYQGVSAVSFRVMRALPQAKALPYNVSFEAHASAESQGAFEAILVDEEGFVTEGAYSNIFWVKNGTIFTRGEGVLEGITRVAVIEQNLVEFQKITLEELQKADEVFLTKTTTGPVPIIQVDEVRIGSGVPGPLTKAVREKFDFSCQTMIG